MGPVQRSVAAVLVAAGAAACGDAPMAGSPAGAPAATSTTTTITDEPVVMSPGPAPRADGIASVSAQLAWVHVGTWYFDGTSCATTHLWRLPRRHHDAIVAVSSDLVRVVELDPDTGSELVVTATWDPSTRRLTGDGVEVVGRGADPALSSDGATLAYADLRGPDASPGSCAPDLVLRDMTSESERVLLATRPPPGHAFDRVARLAWAPDSRVLAVTTSYESSSTGLVDTARASILDPEPLLPPADAVEEAQEVHTVAWLGDGSAVASWSCCHPEHERSGLFLLRSSGKEALSDDRTRAASLAVDPSGRHFAYIHHHDDGRRGTDVVVRRDLGPPQVVATGYPLIDW